jgi:hypothetical protein
MHSLKLSGDSIAQEFSRLMGKGRLVKTADEDDKASFDDLETQLEEALSTTMSRENWARELSSAQGSDEVDGLDVDSMLTDENDDHLSQGIDAIDKAQRELDSADDSFADDAADPFAQERADEEEFFSQFASEEKVLVGLSKIAGSLRAKGESFAADVVEATAISIKGDLKKEAGRKSSVVSGLKKIAEELYRGNDPLAGDMVQVTINKIGGNPFDEMEDEFDKQEESGGSPQDQLLEWSCKDDARGKKIRKDLKTKAAGGDKLSEMLMIQSKEKCPTLWG